MRSVDISRDDNSSMELFVHSPLGIEPDAIRLIRLNGLQYGHISCTVHNATLENSSYVALSYVWGAEAPSFKILLNGKIVWIRPNLWQFLHWALDYLADNEIWIDALCISQDDIPEKNRQIPLMGQVFAQASRVIGFLHGGYEAARFHGHLDVNLLAATRLIDAITGRDGDYLRHIDVVSQALHRLLSHEYWSRLWIVQELELSDKAELVWQGLIIRWRALKTFVKGVVAGLADCRDSRVTFHISANQIDTLPFFDFLRLDRQEHSPGCFPSLFELVLQYSKHSCLVLHDHVFALLALSRDVKNFSPDYNDSMIELAARVFDTSEQPDQLKDFERLMTILEVNRDNIAFASYGADYDETDHDAADDNHRNSSHSPACSPLQSSTEYKRPKLCVTCYRSFYPERELPDFPWERFLLYVHMSIYDVYFTVGISDPPEFMQGSFTPDRVYRLDVVYQRNGRCSNLGTVHLDDAWRVDPVYVGDIIFHHDADYNCLRLDLRGTWRTLLVLLLTLRNSSPDKPMHRHSIDDVGFDRNECLEYFEQRSTKQGDIVDNDERAMTLSPFESQSRVSYLGYWRNDLGGPAHKFLVTYHSVSDEAESREVYRSIRGLSFLTTDRNCKGELQDWDRHRRQAVQDVTRDMSEFPLLSTIRSELLNRVPLGLRGVDQLLKDVTLLLQGIEDIREGVFQNWPWLQESTEDNEYGYLAYKLWQLKRYSDNAEQSIKSSLYGEAQRSAIVAYLRAWNLIPSYYRLTFEHSALESLSKPDINRPSLEYLSDPGTDRSPYEGPYSDSD